VSWERQPLGSICEIISGITKDSKKQGDDYREVPYLRVANVQRLRLDLSEVKTIPARESAIASYRLEPGDILLNEGGDRDKLGRGWIWQGQISECIHQNHVFRARIRDGQAIPKWIAYYANTDEARAYFLATGKQTTNLASISKKNLSALPVPLPPVDVQEDIVAEIDTQLSRIDETVATLQAIQAKLRQARASILKAAVEGRLVENEADLTPTGNISCATGVELLEAIRGSHSEFLAGVLGKSTKKRIESKASQTTQQHATEKLPPGWAIAKWEEIGACINGRNFPSSEYQATGVKLLRPGNLGPDGKTIWSRSKTKCLPERFADENPMQCLANGDIVMNLTAQSLKDDFLGRVCIVKSTEPCLLNQRIAKLVPNMIFKPYALMVFMSPQFRAFVKTLNTGSLIQHMFTKDINCFYFPIPSLPEQQRIAQEFERRFSVLDQVEATINASLRRCGQLRQAVLERAFGG